MHQRRFAFLFAATLLLSSERSRAYETGDSDRPGCPADIEHLIGIRDGEADTFGLFKKATGTDIKSACHSENTILNNTDAYALEKDYQLFKDTHLLNLPDSFLADCLNKPRTRYYQNGDQWIQEMSIPTNDQRAIEDDYRYYELWIKQQTKADIQTIVGIDTVLGYWGDYILRKDASQRIGSAVLPETQDWAKYLKSSCKRTPFIDPTNPQPSDFTTIAFQAKVDLSNSVLSGIEKLRAEEDKLYDVHEDWAAAAYDGAAGLKNQSHPLIHELPEKNKARLAELQGLENQMIDIAPWLRGSKMNDFLQGYPHTPATVATKLREQMYLTRSRVLEHLQELWSAAACVNGEAGYDCMEHVSELLDEGQPLNESVSAELFERQTGPLTAEQISARSLVEAGIGAASCRHEMRKAVKEFNSAITDFVIGTTLTIGSFGLFDIVMGGRAAAALRGAASLSEGALAAATALTAMDVTVLSLEGKKAFEECRTALYHRLTAMPELLDQNIDQSCNGSVDSIYAETDLSDCRIQAILVGVSSLASLPLNLAIFKRIETPAAVLVRAGFAEDFAASLSLDLAATMKRAGSTRTGEALDVIMQLGPQILTDPVALKDSLSIMEGLFRLKKWGGLTTEDIASLVRRVAQLGPQNLSELAKTVSALSDVLKLDLSDKFEKALFGILKNPEPLGSIEKCQILGRSLSNLEHDELAFLNNLNKAQLERALFDPKLRETLADLKIAFSNGKWVPSKAAIFLNTLDDTGLATLRTVLERAISIRKRLSVIEGLEDERVFKKAFEEMLNTTEATADASTETFINRMLKCLMALRGP